MKAYLVGGAVRDKLLNLPVKDRDWVVVGATPEEMKAKGFKPVGQDFPVFLHPENKEEYALARTERKSGHGYAGFTFHTSPDVTLEEDLIRRDLTINAMAEDYEGNIVDPYNGQQDLAGKLIRHVSPAFSEDPLRILRVARFTARFHSLGFTVADDTAQLMKDMVNNGEASWLVAERVWQETVRALAEPNPEIYFKVLNDCGALEQVMPELSLIFQSDGVARLLRYADKVDAPENIRFALLFSQSSQETLTQFAGRIRCPSSFTELASITIEHKQKILSLNAQFSGINIVALFEATDAFRRPERFADFLSTLGIIGNETEGSLSLEQSDQLLHFLEHCRKINANDIVKKGFKGREIGLQLSLKRIEAIDLVLAH